MCEPTTLAVIGIGASLVGGAVTYAGIQQQASAQSSAFNYQAQVARNNAVIAQQNAERTQQAGDVAAQNKLIETGQRTAAIRAVAGASGVDANTGSPLNLQESNQKLGTLDALTIRNNAARAAYGYQVQGMSQTAQAGLDVASGANAVTGGQYAGAGSLVGSAGTVSDRWLTYQSRGLLTQ